MSWGAAGDGSGAWSQFNPQLVDAVYAHTYDYDRLYGRPIDPLGQVWAGPF
jgi:hypothetical protein